MVGISGQLGTGKTELVRALIQEACGDVRVQSPSYILEYEYLVPKESGCFSKGIKRIVHFDLYRLHGAIEDSGLGGLSPKEDELYIVEWPEKLEGVTDLLSHHLHIEFAAPIKEASAGSAGCGNPDESSTGLSGIGSMDDSRREISFLKGFPP